jgi:carboxyl-terminal processing protease
VKAFQKANKLPVTGKIDKQTAELLETKVLQAVRDDNNDIQLKTAMKVLFQ